MKLNWKLLIALSYLAFVSGMVLLAIKSSKQNLELVNENYYERAVKYQDVIDASNNISDTDSRIKINYLHNEKAVKISTDGVSISLSGRLFFYKPDKAADDFSIDFKTDENGEQLVSLSNIDHGYWKVEIDWKNNGKEYHDVNKIFVQ